METIHPVIISQLHLQPPSSWGLLKCCPSSSEPFVLQVPLSTHRSGHSGMSHTLGTALATIILSSQTLSYLTQLGNSEISRVERGE